MDDTIHRSYEGFAYVYDTFMDNVPYEEWAEYVTGILEEYGITDGLVLDLGCGTGSMTELLAEKGYDMIGVDLSAEYAPINNYLDPGGIFLFDLNTPYKYREILGDTVIAENREECSFIWENTFYEEDGVNEYDLTIFRKEEDDLYRKYEETHFQKALEPERVKELIREAGMEFVAVYDAFTREAPKSDSERIYFIAREQGK